MSAGSHAQQLFFFEESLVEDFECRMKSIQRTRELNSLLTFFLETSCIGLVNGYVGSPGFHPGLEQVKALMDGNYGLTEYGKKVVAFQNWRATQNRGNWRTAPVTYYVKRFPDGYWGQSYSTFIPDHPYGSWVANPYHHLDDCWFKTLEELSHGTIPREGDTWNATLSPYFKGHSYQTMAGIPPMVVFDQFGAVPEHTKATFIDLSSETKSGRSAAISLSTLPR